MEVANQKMKSLRPELEEGFVDQDLNVEMGSIYFEYRKEYIEFFMAFFKTEQIEVKEEVKLMAQDAYENIKGVSIQNIVQE